MTTIEKQYRVIGTHLPRADSIKKVKGEAIYGSDIKLDRMLYCKVVRSPYAHAKIVNIDVSRAMSLLGVEAIITGEDVSPDRYGNSIEDQPILTRDIVRYVGEPVVAIAAIDELTAEKAVNLVKVEYEELTPLLNVAEAIKSDAVLVHKDMMDYKSVLLCKPMEGTNICNHVQVISGDIEKGFAESDFVFENTFETPMVQHMCMETQVALAKVSPNGEITVIVGEQSPHDTRKMIAKLFNTPLNKVHVTVPELGGGFGAKLPLKLEPIVISLAIKLKHKNKWVKWLLNREEELTCSVVRSGSVVKIKTGVKKDGTIVARKVEFYLDSGAYADKGPTIVRNAGYASVGPYKVPNVRVDSYCLYTNKVPGAAFRGYGVPQVAWAYESQADIIAHKLNMDPLEFRLKNVLQEGDLAYTGEHVRSIAVKDCLEKSAEQIGWRKPNTLINPKKRRGKGVACMWKNSASPSYASAFVQVNADETVTVSSGVVDMGQGWETIAIQIVSEELSIPMEKIRILPVNTDYCPYNESTSSSRGTFTGGNAVKNASIDVRNQLCKLAAEILEANIDELKMENGKIISSSDPKKQISISNLLSTGSYGKLMTVIGRGHFYSNYVKPLDPVTGQSERPTAFWMFAAQAAEVEIDIETGKVEILHIAAAHDVGKALNRMTCEQQIEGALLTGIGYALSEELIFDSRGKVRNCMLVDYKIPTAMDIPQKVTPILIESAPHWMGPYGAKGLGEPALAPTAPSIANAIYDAIGIRFYELPLTSEKILKGLKSEREII